MTKHLACLLAILAVAVQPCAQENTHAPRELFRIECDGPAAWRTKFAPTNFGAMLASEEGAKVWKPRLLPFQMFLQRLLATPAEGEGVDLARARWLGYSGRIEFVLWLDAPADPDEKPVPYAALRVHGDGRCDLDAMAADVRMLLAKQSDGGFKGTKVGERTCKTVTVGKLEIGAPERFDDTFVLLVGDPAGHATAESLVRALPKPAKGPALRVVAHGEDFERSMRAFDAWLSDCWRALGVPSLQSLEFRIGTAGPFVQVECAAEFHGEERGLFGAFLPAGSGLPPLLHLLPRDRTPWKAGHFDVAALWRTGTAVADAFSEDAAGTSHARFVKQYGFDPLTDCLDHLHTDYLLVSTPGWNEDDGFVIDGCIVFRLRDEAKFAAGFERMRASWKPAVMKLRDEQHDGVTITHYGTLFLPLQVAIARGLVFVAIGDNGHERIVDLLDRSKNATASATPPDDWAPVLRHAAARNNGIGQADLHGVLTTQVAALTGLLALALPDDLAAFVPDYSFAALAEEITPLLERHGLRTVRTATGHDGGRYSLRVFW